MKIYILLTCVVWNCICIISRSEKVFLLDTTTKSSLDWPHYRPNSDASETSRGWLEESYSHEENGVLVNWRSYVVCDVAYPASEPEDHDDGPLNDRDNWLSTPFIKLPTAAGRGPNASPKRIFVEITFNIRDCDAEAQPPSRSGCKETFAVAYHLVAGAAYEKGRPPAWRYRDTGARHDTLRWGWTLLDRVTATQPGNITTRTLTFRVEPSAAAGFYLAFHDTGACLSLLSLKVYALSCPATVIGRASLTPTWTGPELTSVISGQGKCSAHSAANDGPIFGLGPAEVGDEDGASNKRRHRGLGPKYMAPAATVQYLCKADGTWFGPSNKTCTCNPGYQPADTTDVGSHAYTSCTPCPVDSYKHSSGNFPCSLCPVNSVAPSLGSVTCSCLADHYRPASIFYADSACGPPPPAPYNLSASYHDQSSVVLVWGTEEPVIFNDGQGPEPSDIYKSSPVTYRLACDVCDYNAKYSPGQLGLNVTRVTISHLKPGTIYSFVVYAENALSQIAGVSNYASIMVTTENYALEKVEGLRIQEVGPDFAKVVWDGLVIGASPQHSISSTSATTINISYEIGYKLLEPDVDIEEANDLDSLQPPPSPIINTHSTNATLTHLRPASRYLVKIRGRSGRGVGHYSQGVYFETLPAQSGGVMDNSMTEFSVSDVEDTSPLASVPSPAHHVGFIVGGALVTTLTAICLIAAVLLFLKRKRQSFKGKTSSDCDSLDVRTGPEAMGGENSWKKIMTPLFPPSFFKSTLTSLGRGGLVVDGTLLRNNTNPLHSYPHNRTPGNPNTPATHHLHHQTNKGIATSYATNNHLNTASAAPIYGDHHHQPGGGGGMDAALTQAKMMYYGKGSSFKRQRKNHHAAALILPNHHAKVVGSGNHKTAQPVPIHPATVLRDGSIARRYVLSTGSSCHLSCSTLGTEPGNSGGGRTGSSLLHTYEDPNHLKGVGPHYVPEIEESDLIFESGALVGRGEFGEVCRAALKLHQSANDSGVGESIMVAVAVKTLKPGASEKARTDFLAEAQIMAHFEEGNVIRLLGVMGKNSPTPAIVTEYMEHGALDIFLRNNEYCFRISQLLEMLKGIGSGMRYLSELSFVHRDLAARNILVNHDLVCKVSDFGLSREIEGCLEGAYTTKGGKIPVRWTAPEAIAYRRFTTASDVWSYGVLAWEILSYGDRPYWNWSNQDVVTAIDKGYRLPPPMYCPEIVHRLMLQCWTCDPKARPNFRNVCDLLDKIIEDEESQNLPATFKPQNYDPFGIDAFNTVEDWLNSIKMGRYAQTFERAGILTLQSATSQLPSLSPQALLDRLGIVPLGHRNKVLLSIRSLQYPFPSNREIYEVARPDPQTECHRGSSPLPDDQSFYRSHGRPHQGHVNLMMFNSDSDATNTFPHKEDLVDGDSNAEARAPAPYLSDGGSGGGSQSTNFFPQPKADFYYYHHNASTQSRPENFKSYEERQDKLTKGFLV